MGISRTLALAIMAVAATSASADTLYEDYSAGISRSQEVQSLGVDAFGETIDPYSGRVEFYVEDLSIRGNNGLDISIGRSIEAYDTGFRPGYAVFGAVTLSIPRLEGVFANESGSTGWVAQSDTDYTKPNVNRCSALSKAPPEVDGSRTNTSFESNEYWHGNHLVIPGKTKQLMLEAGPLIPASYEWSTNQNWVFSCLPQTSNGVPGEGFLAFSPDGVKYYFDRVIKHQNVTDVDKPDTFGTSTTEIDRAEWYIYPSKAEDRFGNALNYTYTAENRISEITSNDGRRVTFGYLTDGSLATISDGTRTWQYSDELRRVIYPDGSIWNMSISGGFGKVPSAFNLYTCATAPSATVTGQATITIDLPSGARGAFAFAPNRRGISYVASQCGFGSQPGQGVVKVVDDIALTTKTITGPGLTQASWTYTPGPANDSFAVHCSAGCVSTRTTQITNPDGSYVRSTFSNRQGSTEGDLLSEEVYAASGALVSSTAYSYEYAQFANFDIGYPPPMAGDRSGLERSALRSRVTTVDGTAFSWQALSYDSFARPLRVTRSNSTGASLTEDMSYYDDLTKWVIGQVRSVTCVEPTACKPTAFPNGIVVSQTDYDPTTALPLRGYAFGKLQHTFAHNADGTLATVTDGNNNLITLSAWKRGIPQTIQFPPTPESPSGAVKSAVVNDDGTIASVTDENHYKTCYGYDAMGRLASITYPSEAQQDVCDTSTWASTTFALGAIGSSEYGIAAGHWKRTISVGNAREVAYFDALRRPLVQERYDAANPSATRSITVRRYDTLGRQVFESSPLASIGTYGDTLSGATTQYDALSRVTRMDQASELGPLVTTTEYLPGLQTRVTNPRLKATTVAYLAYDQPTADWPLSITLPEGAFTDVSRDVFGKPLSITRRDAAGMVALTRYYIYDAYQQLCKTIEPEAGATVVDYDGVGNPIWSATGLALPSLTDCNRLEAQNSGRRVQRAFDARRRVTSLSFPDLNGNQSRTYTPDGLLSQTTTLNEGGATSVVNTYSYNHRRLLTSESSSQSGWQPWSLGYGYNANGDLSTHVYQNGPTVSYAPNALGQPTQAGSYATSASYYPNGAMAQFTYGNGLVHSLTQNVRGLPDRSIDSYGSTVVLDDGYDYDANGNVAAISDALPTNRGNRDMTYDGLDRLTSSVSPMFGIASYNYDVLDNLTHVVAPGRDHFYCYDTTRWQLTNVKTTNCSGSTVVGLGYDDQGNLGNKNGLVHKFDYDNRLREVVGRETYRYDGYGRRVLARQPTTGDIMSVYDQGGVLRHQQNQREAKSYDFITLNGSLVARVSNGVSPSVPVITAPSYSTSGSYTVQWSVVPGTTSYEVQEAASGGAWQTLYVGAGLSQAVAGRATGSYGYQARACNATGCSAWSAASTVSVQLPPAGPPSLTVPATGINGAYAVSWGTVAGATSYALEESFNGGGWTAAYNGGAQSTAFSGRAVGSYGYRIKACNPAGCSGYSATGTVQVIYPPAAAPSLSAPGSSATGTFTVSWTSVDGSTSYQLDESANGGTWNQIQNTAATSTAPTGKVNGSYAYRVRACNGAGCGAYSGTAITTVLLPPSATPSLSVPASSTTGSYAVSWTSVASASVYQLEEQVNGGGWTLVQNDANTSRAFSGKGTANFGYHARGCNPSGCGPWSGVATVSVIVPPPMPASVSGYAEFIDSRMKEYSLWWADSAGATYYELRSTTTHYSGPNTYFDFTGVGTKTFSVRACNSAGCSDWKAGPTL